MEKHDVIRFFNRRAAAWDSELTRDNAVIQKILDNAQITEGKTILDIGCGTGVLIPDYLQRRVKEITAVDISTEMIKIAKSKFPQSNIHFMCQDAEALEPQKQYDCIMIYNAFPHFPHPERLIAVLSGLLNQNGTLTVAHGAGRAEIDRCHKAIAAQVSVGLMDENNLAVLFSRHLDVTVKISDNRMYQVTGVRKQTI